MKALLILAASAWMSTPAHAVTFNCEGKYSTQGSVRLVCDDAACAVTGSVTDQNTLAQRISIENCGGVRRSETNAHRYQALAYYDVSDRQCWANYIRVAKQFNPQDGTIEASLVQTGGGDQHDYSGYQYLYLSCKVQN